MMDNNSHVQNSPISIYWARIYRLDPETIDESNSPKVFGHTMMDEPLTIIAPAYTKRGLT